MFRGNGAPDSLHRARRLQLLLFLRAPTEGGAHGKAKDKGAPGALQTPRHERKASPWCVLVLGSWGRTMRSAVRNNER